MVKIDKHQKNIKFLKKSVDFLLYPCYNIKAVKDNS